MVTNTQRNPRPGHILHAVQPLAVERTHHAQLRLAHLHPQRLMQRIPQLLVAPAVLGLLPPGAALSAQLNLAGINKYASNEQITSIGQFTDVRPTDWAYQALSNLIERYGCVAGYPGGTGNGQRAMTRFEAAALLNACLERVTEVTDELNKLVAEFGKELAILKGRVDGLETRINALEAQQFSTTTKLKVDANMVVGGNSFYGSARDLVSSSSRDHGAVTFNYDLRISFDTSFTGEDLLRTRMRVGNFDGNSNSFYGAGPSRLSQLEAAFEEDAGPNLVGIDRLYYQFPAGNFTVTIGAYVEQNDMLAMFPSVYPDTTILDTFTNAGSQVAYDFNVGPGVGIWWKQDAWSVSVQYIAHDANIGNPGVGGIGTQSSRATSTVQVGYQQEQWALALVYSADQGEVMPYSTDFLQSSLSQPGLFHTLGLAGYWQPDHNGWIPSISVGGEITRFDYSPQASNAQGSNANQAVSWAVGLQWLDALAPGNSAGLAFGQAPYATSLVNGDGVNDANWMWEWWYKFQVSDAITVTPALFYLSRPLGQNTPQGQSFNQLGALVKTQFRF